VLCNSCHQRNGVGAVMNRSWLMSRLRWYMPDIDSCAPETSAVWAWTWCVKSWSYMVTWWKAHHLVGQLHSALVAMGQWLTTKDWSGWSCSTQDDSGRMPTRVSASHWRLCSVAAVSASKDGRHKCWPVCWHVASSSVNYLAACPDLERHQ